MIATGLPADGSDALTADDTERPGFIPKSTQRLANPARVHNPTHHSEVHEWIASRVARDIQLQESGARDWPTAPKLGDTADDSDLAALLARDHNAFHKLTNRLKYTPSSAKGAADDQVAERAAAVDGLRDGLERHERA